MLGTIIGDTAGSVYEFNNARTKHLLLFGSGAHYTDDSIMTLAVMEMMQSGAVYDREKIIDVFKKWGRAFPRAGYGGRFKKWLQGDSRTPYNSYGNGAAMRISPVGFYAKDEEEVKRFSKAITEVTHNHPEGLKGAEITAMCIFYALHGKSKQFIRDYVAQYYDIDFNYGELVRSYRFDESCQGTVPQAIYCFLISESFEDCLRTSISIGGDSDTVAAISCAIAEAYYREIPVSMVKEACRHLPAVHEDCRAAEIICNYYKNVASSLFVEN